MRGLLHRIAAAQPARPLDPVDSIREHLSAILNTERGDGFTQPTLGVDLSSLLMRWPSTREAVLQQLTETIERFEPRLSNVDVRTIPGTGTRLEIHIHAEYDAQAVHFRTELAPAGRVAVSECDTD